jgi:hypothetical protein
MTLNNKKQFSNPFKIVNSLRPQRFIIVSAVAPIGRSRDSPFAREIGSVPISAVNINCHLKAPVSRRERTFPRNWSAELCRDSAPAILPRFSDDLRSLLRTAITCCRRPLWFTRPTCAWSAKQNVSYETRTHFFAVAAQVMRHIRLFRCPLIDLLRSKPPFKSHSAPASAANAGGFLLVSLSKTPRNDVLFQPEMSCRDVSDQG